MKINIFYNTDSFDYFIEEFGLKWLESRISEKVKEIIATNTKISFFFFRSKEIKDLIIFLNDSKEPLKINNQIIDHLNYETLEP